MSKDPIILAKFSQDRIVYTLGRLKKDHIDKTIQFEKPRLQRTQPVPNKLARNKVSGGSFRPKPVSKKVQTLNFDPDDPFANFDDTQYYDNMGIYTTRYQEAVINSIANGKPEFDVSQPCKVCSKTGHTFDDCPVLNNTPFLRKHYISMKLHQSQQNRKEQEALGNTYATNRVSEEVIEFDNEEDNDEDHVPLQDFHSEDC